MSTENTKVVYRSIPLPTLLTIIFLVLKLCNVITWSWWWVFAPLWIPACLVIVGLVLLCVIAIASGY